MAIGRFLNRELRHQEGANVGVLGTAKLKHRNSKHFVDHNARKRCLKKKFDGIHDRFQRDPVYRDSQLKLAGLRRRALRWTS